MAASIWPLLRRELQRALDAEALATWFDPLRVAQEDDGRLVLVAPTPRILHTLEESFRTAVDRAAASVKGPAFRVLFSLEEATAPTPPPERPAKASKAPEPRLDPRYVFDTFVVGNSNQFAHAASRAVAENPSKSYNPLFLYGGVGLGKTHLLHAIGHHIVGRHPQLVVRYLAAEQFVNELISSLRFNRMPDFRERYRNIDVLLVDDIQFLANKERTQEEFFHTFNTLYTRQKQIILSSDSSPRAIPAIEERLRSRFEWGLIADIQPPDLETKVAILRRKAELERAALPDDVALFIAGQVRSNIRELEGLLNRVLAFSSLTGKPLSLDLAQETLTDILPPEQRADPVDIVRFVARHYGLKVSEIKSRSNAKQVAFPRQVAMYLCRRLTGLSYPEIGKLFNGKHHSTVMHSVEKIETCRGSDIELDRTLQSLIKHFG